MIYLETNSTDPYFNLAFEQYVFDHFDTAESYFMLWQNDNTIVVGKHQNTLAEINSDFVRDKGIRVVRRLSGGGAVYHDLGNLNFTFIADAAGGIDFSDFCAPVVSLLQSLGVPASLSGRNDMTIDGAKFSGNAQYIKRGRVMHHGTILFNSDLGTVSSALNVRPDKIESKAVSSVRARITNVRPHLKEDMDIDRFWRSLKEHVLRKQPTAYQHRLTDPEIAAVKSLKEAVYDTWEWNYGSSPAYDIHKARRFPNCGRIELHMNVKNGRIQDIAFTGDYFGAEDDGPLIARLKGQIAREDALKEALKDFPVMDYFANITIEQLIEIIIG